MAGMRRRDFIAAAGSTAVAWPRARSPDWLKFKDPAAPAVKREAEGGLGKAPMTTLTLRMIKGDFIVTGPDVEPSNASPAARPETGAPSTIRHRRLKR